MSHLVDRLRRQRELKVAIGAFTFLCRRPTAEEMVGFYRDSTPDSEVARRHVVGWEGVTEDDVVGGGVKTPLPFDAGLWAEWCADRPDFWPVLSEKLLEAYRLHDEKVKAAGKN